MTPLIFQEKVQEIALFFGELFQGHIFELSTGASILPEQEPNVKYHPPSNNKKPQIIRFTDRSRTLRLSAGFPLVGGVELDLNVLNLLLDLLKLVLELFRQDQTALKLFQAFIEIDALGFKLFDDRFEFGIRLGKIEFVVAAFSYKTSEVNSPCSTCVRTVWPACKTLAS